jgi:hypothetical protein
MYVVVLTITAFSTRCLDQADLLEARAYRWPSRFTRSTRVRLPCSNPEQSRRRFRHWSPARPCKRIDLLNEPSKQVIAVVRSRTRLWVVDFAWLTRCGRLGWDVERLSETVESLIYACMTRLMLRRLA